MILYGPPGTGKTRAALEVRQRWARRNGADSVLSVTFHPSYGYEDFVRGYKPVASEGTLRFEITDGILLNAFAKAREKPTLLVIDEINRGDVSRIFGELVTYVERDKRDEPFTLSLRRTPQETISVPVNLKILATMNTADKSINLLDIAIRRRFALFEMLPDPTVFATAVGWLSEVGGLSLAALLVYLNDRLLKSGVEPDRLMGHALFQIDANSPAPAEDLKERVELDVYPLLADYFFLERSRIKLILGDLVDNYGRLRKGLTANQIVEALREAVLSGAGEVALPQSPVRSDASDDSDETD